MLDAGVLGINARNLLYIGKCNPAKAVRLADSKIATKHFLSVRGIPLPATYATITTRHELWDFDFDAIPAKKFIIKPARGSRGRGIFCIEKTQHLEKNEISLGLSSGLFRDVRRGWQGFWDKGLDHQMSDDKTEKIYLVNNHVTSEKLLKTYCLDILEGKQSLQNKPDQILIEELIVPGAGFSQYCEHGLADIRVIVYNFIPVAAMLRMPTKRSEGKANLDRGGVGLGVEVGSGRIISMCLDGSVYKKAFPEQYAAFFHQHLPYREQILQRSTQIQYYVNLGYLALDRVITDDGPKLLEINARAGLKIQLALDLPLRKRLEKIADVRVSSPDKGVEIAQSLFTESTNQRLSATKVLDQSGFGALRWTEGSERTGHDVYIEIDLQKKGVTLDKKLFALIHTIEDVKLRYGHDALLIQHKDCKEDKQLPQYHIILGKDVIMGYVVRPTSEQGTQPIFFRPEMLVQHEKDILRVLDNKLHLIGSKLVFSRYFTPTNFLEQFDKFLQMSGKYNPQFVYAWPRLRKLRSLEEDLYTLRSDLIDSADLQSAITPLFVEKREELLLKQQLLVAYIKQDFDSMESLQQKYRGLFDKRLLQKATDALASVDNNREDLGIVLSRSKLKKHITTYLAERGWSNVEIRFTPEMAARMSVKKQGDVLVLQIAPGVTFRKYDLFSALAHELMHLERYTNGMRYPRNILKRGTAKHFIDEEGLAIWAAEQELPDSYEKTAMWKKYRLVNYARTHNFVQVADYLRSYEDRSLLRIFKGAYRLKRGIHDMTLVHPGTASLQDTIYAQGYERIYEWLDAGGQIDELKKAKIKIEDLIYIL